MSKEYNIDDTENHEGSKKQKRARYVERQVPFQKLFSRIGDVDKCRKLIGVPDDIWEEWMDPEGPSPFFARNLERRKLEFEDKIRQEALKRGLGKRDGDGNQIDPTVSNDILKMLMKQHVPEYKNMEGDGNQTTVIVLPNDMSNEKLMKIAKPSKTIESNE